MRTSTRFGIVGSAVAVAGSAAFAALAPTAGAAAGQAASAGYDSTASATVGAVNVAGTEEDLLTASATPATGPQSGSLGSGQVTSQLKAVPTLGPAILAALQTANPGNTDLATVSATANADGTSTACAAVLAADCTTRPMSLIVKLGLTDLVPGLAGTPVGGLLAKLGPLSSFVVALSINGPRASCAVGPAGSGDVYATDDPAGASLDIRVHGKSILPHGPVPVSGGEIFAQVLKAEQNSPVAGLLNQLMSASPLSLTIDPNSRKYISGSKATATAGEIGLDNGSTTVLDIKSATATCGPNTETESVAPVPSSPSSPSTGSSTSGETPLTGIQTDEGRWSVPAAASYLALAGQP